jgi:hypothetical protein
MNKKLVCFLVSLLTLISANSQEFRWDIQVTDPDFELKNYKLDKKAFKPYLEKTSWRCKVGPEEVNNGIYLRELDCDYSIEKAGTVKTRVSCSEKRKYGEVFVELFDERKNLTFQLMLKCNKTE